MWKILILCLTVVATLIGNTESRSYPDDDDEPKSSRYRQTIYNFRPQSALLEEENDYRSYDNNFSPLGPDGAGGRSFGGGSYRSARRPNPPPRPYFNDDDNDDYPVGPSIPDDDDIELDPVQPNSPFGFNFRSPVGGNARRPAPFPISAPRRYWDDQTGRERGDPSYSFGYELDDQSRRENSDIFGNVNGDFSFVDDEGTFRKVTYSAGANKGFVVNSKTPPDSPGPSPPRRIKKPPPVLLQPGRHHSRPNNGWEPTQKQTNNNNNNNINNGGDSGVGIGINVVKGSSHPVSPNPPPRPVMTHRPKEGWNSQGSNHGNQQPTKANAVPAAVGADGSPAGVNEDGSPGAWGALGNNRPTRPRQMRKRKPALVVKVRRPVGSQSQIPAPNHTANSTHHHDPWMYYRPPNNRPLVQQQAGGWTSKKPTIPPPQLLPQADEDCDQGTGWSEDENDIADPYPKDKSYSFGYNAGDQTRQEVSDAYGNIRGSYSYVDPNGVQRTVHYTAGHSGFKVLSAEPSILRPVYANAPRVSSIPIPLPVMSQLNQFSSRLTGPVPQASAIVYHIHPGNGIGAEWRPWESSKRGKSRYGNKRTHHHRRSSSSSRRNKHAQQNLFHLTHENENYFPAYNGIQSEAQEATISPDIELLPETVENIYVKELKQQLRRSQKLKRLQQEFQEPILEYNSKLFPPRSSQNRLGFTTDTLDLSPIISDEQVFLDYEQMNRNNHHSNSRHRHGRKDQTKKTLENNPSDHNNSNNNETGVKVQDHPEPTVMAVEGEHEIQAYSGGYGDKNPLLVISEMPATVSTRESKERSGGRSRLQRKTSDDGPGVSIENSMVMIADSIAAESTVLNSVSDSESIEVSRSRGSEQSTEKPYISPAALLHAKMSSPAPSKPTTSTTSVPSIKMTERGTNVMHFPGRKLETGASMSRESRNN